ncbi:MAG TPA: NADH-quinone oxidoreductase subunit N [Candidatus Binatia bacterium]|jgi:NADH-quinone oxidoreductase subunit N
MPQALNIGSILPILPLLVGSVWAMLVLVAEMFSSSRRFAGVAWLSVIGLVGVAALALQPGPAGIYVDALANDTYTSFFTVLTCAIGIGSMLLSIDYLPAAGVRKGEYYPLMFFAVLGVIVMAAATDLIVMFVGLETMSMAVYVLAGILRNDVRSNEASLKYFLLGAFASALLLYGIATLFAMTGSTNLAQVAAAISRHGVAPTDHLVMVLGAGLVLIGLGFKIAAVPFHLWAPDVYEGAPSSVTAFMATAVKAGGFAALMRTAVVALGPLHADLQMVLWAASAVTMTVGNLVALRQLSLKRMLAYSSIAHTGYLLMGVVACTPQASAAVLFYLAGYAAMNLVAFGVLIAMARGPRDGDQIADYAGLAQTRPLLAAAMTISMLSLTGMPPLVGFVGKLYLFQTALQAGYVGLVVIACFNSVLSAAYYLGVVRTMYFEPPSAAAEVAPATGVYAAFVVGVSTILTVVLGIVPAAVIGAATRAFKGVLLG